MYHRQVSSRPRLGAGDHAVQRRAVPTGRPGSRLSITGVTGSPDSRGRVPGLDQRGQLAVGDPLGRPQRQAVVEHRRLPAGRVRDHERRAGQPRRRRVAAQRQRQRGQPLADPGAAARLAEHGPPVQRVLGPGRPVQVDEQVGDGGRRQQRLVPARRAARPGAPAQPSRWPRSASSAATSTSVKSRVAAADPGRPGQVRRLGVEVHRPGRLVVPQPQPGRACRGRCVVTECSANPYSRWPPDPAASNAAASAGGEAR